MANILRTTDIIIDKQTNRLTERMTDMLREKEIENEKVRDIQAD